MHQQPRTIDPPGKPKSSSRSLHVCSVSGRTSNMAAVWHSAAHGTRPASVALCGKTNPSHLFQPCICGLVRKDAAVDRICGFVRKGEPLPLFQPRICGLVRKDAAVDRICGFVRRDEPLPPIPAPHLWPCAERRGRRPHPWLCAERRTPPPYSSPASVALCGKTRPSTASVALCGETHATLPKSAHICGLVRKDGIPLRAMKTWPLLVRDPSVVISLNPTPSKLSPG